LQLDELPISPKAMPFWGWLFCATGCWLVLRVAAAAQDRYGGPIYGAVITTSGIAAVFCAIVGILRFLNWV